MLELVGADDHDYNLVRQLREPKVPYPSVRIRTSYMTFGRIRTSYMTHGVVVTAIYLFFPFYILSCILVRSLLLYLLTCFLICSVYSGKNDR